MFKVIGDFFEGVYHAQIPTEAGYWGGGILQYTLASDLHIEAGNNFQIFSMNAWCLKPPINSKNLLIYNSNSKTKSSSSIIY